MNHAMVAMATALYIMIGINVSVVSRYRLNAYRALTKHKRTHTATVNKSCRVGGGRVIKRKCIFTRVDEDQCGGYAQSEHDSHQNTKSQKRFVLKVPRELELFAAAAVVVGPFSGGNSFLIIIIMMIFRNCRRCGRFVLVKCR